MNKGDLVIHKETQENGIVKRVNWSNQAEVEWFLLKNNYLRRIEMCNIEDLEVRDLYEELMETLVPAQQLSFWRRVKCAWKLLKGRITIQRI